MSTKTYQPRWLAYCAAVGHDPDAFEGGKRGADFITWIDRHLRDWRKANGVHPEARLMPADHESFTAHLESLAGHDPNGVVADSPGSVARPPAPADPGHLHSEDES